MPQVGCMGDEGGIWESTGNNMWQVDVKAQYSTHTCCSGWSERPHRMISDVAELTTLSQNCRERRFYHRESGGSSDSKYGLFIGLVQKASVAR